MKLLEPWLKVDNISVIDFDMLRQHSIDTLLLDMDNTVVPWHTFNIDETIGSWITQAKQLGFKICIISNNQKWRIVKITTMLDVEGVWGACKPMLGGYIKALKTLGSHKHNSVFVGDQIFTDIFGANILGVRTILVCPISKREYRWTRFMRRIESLVTGRSFERNAGEHGK
jgi:uncharacterized protein